MTLLTLDQYFGPWRNHPDATKLRRDDSRCGRLGGVVARR